MSASPPPLYTAFTVVNSFILISTLLRLSFRLHLRRFWWEDAWAAAAFISGAAFVITQYIAVEIATRRVTGFVMVSCWITSVFSTITLCAVRMSILYSTIRIMSPSSRIRVFARIVAIFLFIFCATSVGLRSSLCTNPITLKGTQPGTRRCIDDTVFMVFQVTTDFISDAVLVFLPLKLLWRVKLPRRQRRMILASFSSSAIVSIFSLVHAIFPNFNNVKFDLTLNLETTSGLIVCNLLVLVTYMYRVFCKLQGGSVSESDDTSADDDFTTRTPPWKTTEALTTVDLDVDAGYDGAISGVSSSSHSCSAAAEKKGD